MPSHYPAPVVRRLAVLTFLLLLAAGVSVPAYADTPQPQISKAWPKWLHKQMKKDSRKKKTQALNLGDGRIVTSIMGRVVAEPSVFDGGWSVDADIGARVPVNCWIFADGRNLANQLERTHRAMIANIAKAFDDASIKEQLPYYVDIGVRGGTTYAASEWLYTIGTKPEVRVNLSKVRVAKKGGATFACSHPELGYRKAFARLFNGFVDEATVNLPGAAPYYRELVQITLAGKPAGVASMQFTYDQDGDTRVVAETSMLLQIDPRSLIASDTTKIEYARPDGALINAFDSSVENGELKSDLALNYEDDRGWVVDGMYGGKPVVAAIAAEGDILSALGQMQLFSFTVASVSTAPVEFPLWLAEADPGRILTGTIAVTRRGDNRHEAAVGLGPIAMDAELDDDGSVLRAEMPLGANTLRMERVFVEGSMYGGSE